MKEGRRIVREKSKRRNIRTREGVRVGQRGGKRCTEGGREGGVKERGVGKGRRDVGGRKYDER